MSFRVDLMVSVRVRRYLETLLGEEYHVNANTTIGRLLLTMFRQPKPGEGCKPLPNAFRVWISEPLAGEHGLVLDDKALKLFEGTVDLLVRGEMVNYALVRKAQGEELREALARFQDVYGFSEEEWSVDTMQRDFHRTVKKMRDLEPGLPGHSLLLAGDPVTVHAARRGKAV